MVRCTESTVWARWAGFAGAGRPWLARGITSVAGALWRWCGHDGLVFRCRRPWLVRGTGVAGALWRLLLHREAGLGRFSVPLLSVAALGGAVGAVPVVADAYRG